MAGALARFYAPPTLFGVSRQRSSERGSLWFASRWVPRVSSSGVGAVSLGGTAPISFVAAPR